MQTIYQPCKTIVGSKEVMTCYSDGFGGLANTIVFEGDKVISVEQTHGRWEENP